MRALQSVLLAQIDCLWRLVECIVAHVLHINIDKHVLLLEVSVAETLILAILKTIGDFYGLLFDNLFRVYGSLGQWFLVSVRLPGQPWLHDYPLTRAK